jgi:hypothetical protein
MMSVVPDVSLNMESDLVKTIDPEAHELAAQLVFADVSQRDKLLSTGHTMFEAQFQPLIVDNVCLVTVFVVDNTAIIPYKYQTIELENGDKYVVIDPDYSSFFREQRFTAATKDLRESGLFDFIAQIEKIYLEHYVLVKRHLTQQFLANGSVNPQFAPGRWIFTVSAGSLEATKTLTFTVLQTTLFFILSQTNQLQHTNHMEHYVCDNQSFQSTKIIPVFP